MVLEPRGSPSKPSLARISSVTRHELVPNYVPRGFEIREDRWCLCGGEGVEGRRAGGEVLREKIVGEPFSILVFFYFFAAYHLKIQQKC